MPDIYIKNFRPNSDSSSNRVASFDFSIGPVTVKGASLIKSQHGGSFVSMPSTKSDSNEKWYDHVEIDELTKAMLKKQLKQIIAAAAGTKQTDPEVPDLNEDDIPY